MDKETKYLIIAFIIGILLIILAGFSLIWFTASQEAKSYRKFCDKPVKTWDAIFLDLRIDECK